MLSIYIKRLKIILKFSWTSFMINHVLKKIRNIKDHLTNGIGKHRNNPLKYKQVESQRSYNC